MMLTPERLTELRNAGPDYYVSGGTLKLLLAHIDAQQARIDALMLEFCPDEMTEEQKARWAQSQKKGEPDGKI